MKTSDRSVDFGFETVPWAQKAERVRAARRDLAARVHREELAVGQHLLQAGQDREAADHLLRARAEDVRDPSSHKVIVKKGTLLEEPQVEAIVTAPQLLESDIRAQRARVTTLIERLRAMGDDPAAKDLLSVVDHLVRRSIWIVGGDGWAYDIGSSGLDHVLATGRNVNVLVLDTEVYSNTGGQSSKSTPLGAVAKFASAGKTVPKKDIALQAIAYGNVYVARVAMGADPQQTLRAFREAEAYDGPSLVIAYSHCIAHGIEIRTGLDQQYRAVASGHWPLIRYDPLIRTAGGNPFLLDSPRPRISLASYTQRELRYRSLSNTNPAEAERLGALAQEAVDLRWNTYEEMATRGAQMFPTDARKED